MSIAQLPQRASFEPPRSEAPTPSSAPRASDTPRWSVARRIGFRFLFAYFILYLIPFPVYALPFLEKPTQWIGKAREALGLWTETHLMGLTKPTPVVPTGSGDTMLDWALQLDWLLLALAAAAVWTALDRKRHAYPRLEQWLRVHVRFGLATIMLGYGFAKIIPTQMPAPQLERLVEPWGEFSPMGVLWSFMGYSTVYEVFTGIGEALGGLLLTLRRTTTLGALVLCGVLANVVLFNYAFDVPVKLFSTNLLLMAIFLAAPDATRLVKLLVLNRAVPPREMPPLFATVWKRWAGGLMAGALIAWVITSDVRRGLELYAQIGPNAPKSPLYGIWDVESLVKNAVDQPPLLSDSTRLKRVVFGGLSRATFRLMSDSVERYALKVDSAKREITLTARFDPKLARTMSYARPDAHHLVLSGRVNGDSLVVRLRKVDETRFTLVNRGFHWVQELPFNR